MIHPIRRRVLLVLGWYDYRLHRGIEKYALEHNWSLSQDVAREKVIPWGWDGDGILAWLGAGDDLAEFVNCVHKPTVDFSFRRPQLNFTRVLEDTAATGKLVADHLIACGINRFCFFSDAPNWICVERGRGFLGALKESGHLGHWLDGRNLSLDRTGRDFWKRKRDWLAAELKRRPKPVGIFAATDGLALEALECCEAAGVAVPDEVAIVGAGNCLLAVDAMRTPITSVDPDMERIGYEGAAALDRLMNRNPVPSQPIRVPPARLIARKSSDFCAVNHEGIARSLRYLRYRCHEPIGVDELAQVAAMSRRSFHEAFVKQMGRPPGAELQHIRIERAKRLLAETNDKIDTIAEKCGYQNNCTFWVAFRRTTGTTPKKFQTKWNKRFSAAISN